MTELAPVVLNCRAQLARKRKAAIAKPCRAAAAAGLVGPDGKHGFERKTLLVSALFALDVWHKTLAGKLGGAVTRIQVGCELCCVAGKS